MLGVYIYKDKILSVAGNLHLSVVRQDILPEAMLPARGAWMYAASTQVPRFASYTGTVLDISEV